MATQTLHAEQDSVAESHTLAPLPTHASSEPSSRTSKADAVTAQTAWAHTSIASRLRVLKRARHELASLAPTIARAISRQLSRTEADTMVSELLPLLEAMRFLERAAPRLLRAKHLGRRGLPFWLSGIDTVVHRVPFGKVLIIGPSNYPLFLPGVQAFQALAAGNAVVWKPGLGGAEVARIVADVLFRAGLPGDLLEVTGDSVQAGQNAVSSGADKVFFTGSGASGRALLGKLASTGTPCVLELSGNDAAIVLPSADLDRVVAALSFGMRLNGSATCMAPRRILLVDCPAPRRALFLEGLERALAEIPAFTLSASTRHQFVRLVTNAEQAGATVIGGNPSLETLRPLLLLNGTPAMEIAQTDIFAPVLTLIDVTGRAGILAAQAACPLALTTSIFGDERAARALASEITSGAITINDLIVPTADPRMPFGGRRGSGFGITRGAEGLLEMTAVKVISARRNRSTRQYEPTGDAHAALFRSIITATHAGSVRQRWGGLKRAVKAALELKKK